MKKRCLKKQNIVVFGENTLTNMKGKKGKEGRVIGNDMF